MIYSNGLITARREFHQGSDLTHRCIVNNWTRVTARIEAVADVYLICTVVHDCSVALNKMGFAVASVKRGKMKYHLSSRRRRLVDRQSSSRPDRRNTIHCSFLARSPSVRGMFSDKRASCSDLTILSTLDFLVSIQKAPIAACLLCRPVRERSPSSPPPGNESLINCSNYINECSPDGGGWKHRLAPQH